MRWFDLKIKIKRHSAMYRQKRFSQREQMKYKLFYITKQRIKQRSSGRVAQIEEGFCA